jgi:7,8-dihydro-6-hydroxymethylpterin-pyrophosphokinase
MAKKSDNSKKSSSGSRGPMDMDLLFYDDVVIVDGKSLCVPHPRLQERLFVLEPLAEIAPELRHPRFGKTIRELHQELAHAGSEKP